MKPLLLMKWIDKLLLLSSNRENKTSSFLACSGYFHIIQDSVSLDCISVYTNIKFKIIGGTQLDNYSFSREYVNVHTKEIDYPFNVALFSFLNKI